MKNSSDDNEIKIAVSTQTIGYILVLLFSVLFLFFGAIICDPKENILQDDMFYSAKIIKTGEVDTSLSDDIMQTTIIPFVAKITSGEFKNDIIEGVQETNSFVPFKQRTVMQGDSVILMQFQNVDNSFQWKYSSHSRQKILFLMTCFFLLCVIFIGRLKGLATSLSLVFTAVAIFQLYIPGILKGFNIYLLTSIICLFIIVSSLVMINGINRKTFATIAGNFLGVLFSAVCTIIMSFLLDFTGIIDASYIILQEINPQHPVDLLGVLWGGVVIGSLGAIMDVAMTISSALHEVYETMQVKSFSALIKSGMNIGKDAIGTMTNTLILAYIGSSLAMVLLFSAHNKNLLYLVNTEKIAAEIVQAVVGSIGILFAVPATVFIASYIYIKRK